MNRVSSLHLVVGGDSLVGQELAKQLQAGGETVLTTTRRRAEAGDSRLYLDLGGNPDEWQWPREVEVAYLCAGVTRIEACANDPAGSARANVAGISALARRLVACGVFVIYLSTNQVFDGSVAHQRADAPYSPTTEYGRQKAEAERALLALGPSAAVVRFTKILSAAMPLFVGWCRALSHGEVIRPFSDVVMAPVPVSFCVEALIRVSSARAAGITQVSADHDITYADAARYIARCLGRPEGLAQPQDSTEAGVFLGPPRSHTTLDTSRLRDAFGMQIPDVWQTLQQMLPTAQLRES